MSDDNNDDSVGYKRPPKRSRFQSGKSGNPGGRRANVRNLKSDLIDELREKTTVRDDGREQQVSKQRAFIKALVASAIQGDTRATSTLLSLCARFDGQAEGDTKGAGEASDAADLDILESFVGQERKRRSRESIAEGPNSQDKREGC
jgi:Family of unknown function (DUF5681)